MAELHIARGFDLDTDRFLDEGIRVGIFASPGAGKGYLLGVLLEELIDANYPCVMIDPESELWTFREIGALVVGGAHGHVPLVLDAASIREAIRFCFATATPLVFDLGDYETDATIREACDAVMKVYWQLVSADRVPSVLAITEAHVIAPQTVHRGESVGSTLPAILTRGRKRGTTVLLETQRIADIANSVISHCNVRFVGRIDFEDDIKRVLKSLPGVSVADVQHLDRGTFYVPRYSDGPIKVRKRRVTHGAITPGSKGEVTIRREKNIAAVADIAKRLNVAAAAAAEPAPASEATERSRRGPVRAKPVLRDDHTRELQAAQRENERLAERLDASERELAEVEARAEQLTVVAEQVSAVRVALRELLGEAVHVHNGSGGGDYPGDEHVRALIQQHAPTGTSAPPVEPVAVLRTKYLEQSAQRLVAIVRDLTPDERDALLYLSTRDSFVTVNAISLALSGNDGGGQRNRWSRVTTELKAKGLVTFGGSGRTSRRANIDGFVSSGLAPHNPSDQEVADVRDRALYLLQTKGAS